MRDCGASYLHACLLLLLAEGPDHGYDLATRLAPLGLAGADAASTYRALRSLERDGSVGSHWVPSHGGPARRVYHLTAKGHTALAATAADLRRDQMRISRYLARLAAVQRMAQPAPDAAQVAR